MIIDYNFVTSIVSIIAVIITLVIFIVETRNGNLALKTNLLFELAEKFDSPDFKKIREKAATNLLTGHIPNYELSDVLDFFSTIVFYYERKVIDQDLTYQNFAYWMVRYWLCSEEMVALERQIDPLSWKTLERFTKTLLDREIQDGYPPYSKKLLNLFLLEEARSFEQTEALTPDLDVKKKNLTLG